MFDDLSNEIRIKLLIKAIRMAAMEMYNKEICETEIYDDGVEKYILEKTDHWFSVAANEIESDYKAGLINQ